jgi:pepF/M3 family oligoendopeptidase
MATMTSPLPHWDMSRVYPGLQTDVFRAAFERVLAGIAALRALSDRLGIRAQAPAPVDASTVAAFEDVARHRNALAEELRTLSAYISAFVSTNSRDDVAQARQSELQQQLVELQKLDTRFDAWIGSLDVDALIARSLLAREHAFPLRKAAQAARHQMSEPEEDLAASLSPSSGTAWARLHGTVSSQLVVSVPGQPAPLPMSAVRALAHDKDPDVRKAAYDAELQGWARAAVPLAAALNGIKGEVRTLNQRRGWADDLEPMLFANNVDRATLDAIHEACRESFPDFRRYLRAKARLLGTARLPWYDLFAPVGGDDVRAWSFDDAAAFVVEQFGTYSAKLAELPRRALRERWIDAEPRDGKRDGAFCMGVRADESRVFLNFGPSFSSVSTLAHELGHAYHNTTLAPRTAMQRATPMALAETASIFCETIVANAAFEIGSATEKLAILEHQLQGSCQVVVDIHSRFLFESRVFARRARRDLSVNELNALMLEAQRETYGDGLDPDALHPYMWAMKPHYYSTGRSFYNWPYTFGLLFGLGLYAEYRKGPDTFRAGYDDLLSSTGLHSAAELADRFGIDVRSAGFWRASLDVVREQIRRFEGLTGETATGRSPNTTG